MPRPSLSLDFLGFPGACSLTAYTVARFWGHFPHFCRLKISNLKKLGPLFFCSHNSFFSSHCSRLFSSFSSVVIPFSPARCVPCLDVLLVVGCGGVGWCVGFNGILRGFWLLKVGEMAAIIGACCLNDFDGGLIVLVID